MVDSVARQRERGIHISTVTKDNTQPFESATIEIQRKHTFLPLGVHKSPHFQRGVLSGLMACECFCPKRSFHALKVSVCLYVHDVHTQLPTWLRENEFSFTPAGREVKKCLSIFATRTRQHAMLVCSRNTFHAAVLVCSHNTSTLWVRKKHKR